MRILHVSSLWEPVILGGAEMYAANLAAEQRRVGHTVGVVTLGVPGDDVVEAIPAWPFRLDHFAGQPKWKTGIFRLQDVYNPRAMARLRKAIKRFAPDIIHSHSIAGLSTGALTASADDVAHVHHVHDYWLMCRRTTMRLPSGEICRDRSCQAITAARNQIIRRHPPELMVTGSQASVRDHSALPWAAGRMRHLPYTIGIEFEARRASPPTAGQPITFGYIGRVEAQKGVETLLRAFAQLDGPHRLLVAGEGDLSPAVEQAGDRVAALGWVRAEAREKFFADTDCLIVPSNWPETGPMVIQESRGRGVPVIGARIGGIAETVGRYAEPLLFTPGDATELRDAMAAFASDPQHYLPPPDAPPIRIAWSYSDHQRDVEGLYDEAIALRRRR